MIDKLKEDINYIESKCSCFTTNRFLNLLFTYDLMMYVIIMKYYCEIGKYKYETIIKSNELYEINNRIIYLKEKYLKNEVLSINTLLINYNSATAKELLLEYLSKFDNPIKLNNDKLLLFSQFYSDSLYDITGHTSYIISHKDTNKLYYYKIYDEILGINNKHLNEEDIKIEDYNYLYVYDDSPRYRNNKEKNINIIEKYINEIDNVVLYTNYNNISNIRDYRLLLKNIKSIIINKTKAIILFSKERNDNISIINYDKKDIDKLKNIIKNNRKQKDVLVKVPLEDIRNNNYRIGFKLYQLENNEVKDINKLVDENTKYLEKLNDINKKVEDEINKLLNK